MRLQYVGAVAVLSVGILTIPSIDVEPRTSVAIPPPGRSSDAVMPTGLIGRLLVPPVVPAGPPTPTPLALADLEPHGSSVTTKVITVEDVSGVRRQVTVSELRLDKEGRSASRVIAADTDEPARGGNSSAAEPATLVIPSDLDGDSVGRLAYLLGEVGGNIPIVALFVRNGSAEDPNA
ncbi:hypothetical protein, partial [Mycolicibacterium austroafricanum]|uniref:hypothetical protein n=1 Tax=Mycolicibacterium austroafricanum TaxID=39687 RepID=UPI00105739C4